MGESQSKKSSGDMVVLAIPANTAEKILLGSRIKFVHLLFALTGLMVYAGQDDVNAFISYLLRQ